MSEKKVAAVLLPTTAYILRLQPPPARKMIDQGLYFSIILLKVKFSLFRKTFKPVKPCEYLFYLVSTPCVLNFKNV